jgi:hypothetical protein
LVDLKQETYQKGCLDKKIMSDKQCSELDSYIKRCGTVRTTFDMQVTTSGNVVIDTKDVKISNGDVNPKKQEENQITVLVIYQYGSPYSRGKTFPSRKSCEQEQKQLTKKNAGLDYTYKCVKK